MESNMLAAASATSAIAISKVLDNRDLLIEILLCLGFPTTLVRASLLCKRWLGHISDHAFLQRFRKLHPPRFLGFYVEDIALRNAPPRFVSMLTEPCELDAVIHLIRFNKVPVHKLHIHECRNGSVFIHWYDRENNNFVARVYNPLSQRGWTILPSLPSCVLEDNRYCIILQVLSQEDGDVPSYFCLHVEATLNVLESEYCVEVYKLQDCCWHEMLHIDVGQHPHPRSDPKSVLVDSKIYMPAGAREIIVLDLTTSSISIIQFPPGVDYRRRGTIMLSRANDASGVYLIHVKEFQLRVWLHKGENWMLVDNICLLDMCDNVKKLGCTIEDSYTPLLMSQEVDYGDFMFLKMGGCALYLDIKCRTLRKVYETKQYCLGDINPFMMIWPPKFPVLKYDLAKFVFAPLR